MVGAVPLLVNAIMLGRLERATDAESWRGSQGER